MGPELALAVDACATDSAALVVKIGKKVNEVRTFKRKCRQLGADAKLLSAILSKNKSSFKDFETVERFKSCLKRIETFVDSCATMGYAEIGWEVFYKHEFRGLRKEARALRALFTFESVTETLARQDKGFQEVITLQGRTIDKQRAQNQIIVAIRDKLDRDLPAQRKAFAPRQAIRHDFEIDERFSVAWKDESHSLGSGILEGFGKVVCLEMKIMNTTRTFIDLYRDIQEGAFVQRCLGILEAESKYYVVMEDLESTLSLAETISKNELPESKTSRLSLGYDIAKTMAWYHRAQLLLKSLSDRSIILRKLQSGDVCPVLTGVENSRHISDFAVYDARYEAPEYQKIQQHSYETDVWSLGTIIWQTVSGLPPFQITEPALQRSDARRNIQTVLRESDGNPGSLEYLQDLPEVQNIVRQCWNHEPMVRPTAEYVTEALFDAMLRSSADAQPALDDAGPQKSLLAEADASEIINITTVETPILEQVMEVILKARKLNEGNTKFVQLQDDSISKEAFDSLLNADDAMNPVQSYAIGAAIWWRLVPEYPLSDLMLMVPQALHIDGDADETRALISLAFLEEAANSGYRAAYLEIYKAHGTLARRYRDLHETEVQKESRGATVVAQNPIPPGSSSS